MTDLLVQKEVLVELQAVKTLDNIHIAQGLNYLKATAFKVCLLLNFGTPKVQIRRLMK
jgi:GxxExxY protein